MKNKKLQVFVSSTFEDLKEERQAAVQAILTSGNIPAGMELFAAGDQSQMTVIKNWIDESDVYLLILGGRYGTIDSITGKSYTQLEYEYAVEQKKPLFSVVISEKGLDDKVKISGRSILEQDNTKLLKAFRDLVCTTLVKFWDDQKDIQITIYNTLSDFGNRGDLVGWVKGGQTFNAGLLAEEIAKLSNENSDLRQKLEITEPQKDIFYEGESYTHMKWILKNYSLAFNSSLFDFFMDNGSKFIAGVREDLFERDEDYDALKNFGLVQFTTLQEMPSVNITLTQKGYIFYIRALEEKMK